jgi:hypothetical protein
VYATRLCGAGQQRLAGWLLDKLAFFNHLADTKKLTEQLKEIKIKESSKIGSLILE